MRGKILWGQEIVLIRSTCGSIMHDLKAKPNEILLLYPKLSIYTKNRMGIKARTECY